MMWLGVAETRPLKFSRCAKRSFSRYLQNLSNAFEVDVCMLNQSVYKTCIRESV